MDAICCRSLASRLEVPVSWRVRNLCSMSWNLIATVNHWFRSPVNILKSTSMRPISRKYMISPLGIKTTIYQVLSSASAPLGNSACTIVTKFYQLVPSGSSSHVASCNWLRRCSARIPNGPTEQLRQSMITTQGISLSLGKDPPMVNRCTATAIGWPGNATCQYRSTCSTTMW